MTDQRIIKNDGKQVWVRPAVERIETGSAESQRNAVNDASGGQLS